MTLVTLAATPYSSPTYIVTVAVFMLLKQGLNAATRPDSTKTQAYRSLVVTLASVVCMLVAAFILELLARF